MTTLPGTHERSTNYASGTGERRDLPVHSRSFAQDETRLASLARSLLEPGAIYPWPAATAGAHGLDDVTAKRLEQVGWLRRLERGDCEIWHSRLLNWAVAEGLYDRRRTGGITTDSLARMLADMWQPGRLYGGERLGYVPMDVVWLVSDPKTGLPEPEIVELLSLLIKMTRPGTRFFSESLSTVGARILPALSRWLQSIPGLSAYSEPREIQEALLRLGALAPTATRLEAIRLLTHKDPWLQGVACWVIARLPGPEAIHPLWRVRLRLSEEKDQFGKPGQYLLQKQIFEALVACLPLIPLGSEANPIC